MAEDVVIRYRAEVDELTAALKKVQAEQIKIAKNEDASNDEIEKSITTQELAAKKRKQLLELERKELQKLIQLRDLAYDPKKIAAYNTQISKAQQNIKLLGGETEKSTNRAKSALQSFGAAAALAFGAGLSLDAVIQFGKASVNAFLEAEENANRLKFAITQIGGESEVAFDRLIRQSSRLQEITIFSDDSIQQAQAALSAFGLTADQIEELIPKLADFATITSQDIPSAAAQIGAALEGNGREFKKYGIEVSAAATRTENLNSLLLGLDFAAGSAEAATKTLAGELKQATNRADELQESLGERLAPIFVKFKTAILEATLGLLGFNKAAEKTEEINFDAVTDNFEQSAKKLKESGKDVVEVFEARKETIVKSNEQIIASNKELEKRIAERVVTLSQGKLEGDPNNDAIVKGLQAQIEKNQEILKLQNEKVSAIDRVISKEKGLAEATERTLKADQLKALSLDKLNELLTKEQAIKDRFTEDNIKLINAEVEAKKKARDKDLEDYKKQLEKEQEELKRNLEKLESLRIQNIEDQKQRRIAEFEKEVKEITAEGQLKYDITIELEKKLVRDLNEIDQQRNIDPLFRAPDLNATPSQLKNPRNPDSVVETTEDTGQAVEDQNALILQSTSDLLNDLSGLYATFNQIRLNEIEEQKNAQLEAIDLALNANEEALKKGRISQVEAAKVEQQLLAERVAAEKKAADEERKIKRRQAILDKAAALFQIAINTQKAISEVSPVVPLMALAAAAGAAQAAIVIAQPIPYRKGTKSAKGGLSLVDEEGAEAIFRPSQGRLTTLEKGTKVIPFKQTKTYSEAIDSMVDNKFEGFVLNRYVNPALKKAKKEKQQSDNVTFAENISKSFVLNNLGLTEKELEKVRRRGQSINNVDELARAISQYTKRDIYR